MQLGSIDEKDWDSRVFVDVVIEDFDFSRVVESEDGVPDSGGVDDREVREVFELAEEKFDGFKVDCEGEDGGGESDRGGVAIK